MEMQNIYLAVPLAPLVGAAIAGLFCRLIPRWLAHYAGGALDIDVRAGKDFPEDLTPYAIVVQCGGCTVTRKQILVRQYRAARQGVPMTNYGMAISVSQGVIERALECFPAALEAYRRGTVSSESVSRSW